MLYIFNKKISFSKNILHSLTVLYGINEYQSKKICKNIGINPQTIISKLKNNQINHLINYINKEIKIEQKLKKDKNIFLKNLLNNKHSRGIRLNLGLPVRGQRTHTNAKTVRKIRNNFFSSNDYAKKTTSKYKKSINKTKKK